MRHEGDRGRGSWPRWRSRRWSPGAAGRRAAALPGRLGARDGRSSRTRSGRRSTARRGCRTRSTRRSAASTRTSTRSARTAATSSASSSTATWAAATCTSTSAAIRAARRSRRARRSCSRGRRRSTARRRASPTRPARMTANGINATVYRVNQDADQWHILLAWHHGGSLYTVSEHVILPYDNATQVMQNLQRLLQEPRARPARSADAAHTASRSSAARRPPPSAAPESTSSSTSSASAPARPLAEPAGMPAGAAPHRPRDCPERGRRGRRAAAAQRGRHRDARQALRPARRAAAARRRASATSTRRYALTPAGLGVTVAWGLPYFDTLRRGSRRKRTCRTTGARGKSVLLPTRRFPSDPADTILEENDVAVLLRSDRRRAHRRRAQGDLRRLPFFTVTSIRRGFAGGGFDGGQSLPKKMAVAAGVPGADLIPDGSELFLGFTSTQKAGLGPRTIANHETLGYVDLRAGYFRNGTHMHLSHLNEDLEAWYLNFDFDERVLDGVPARHDERQAGNADGSAGPDGRLDPRRSSQRQFEQDRPLRPQRVDPGDVAAPAGHRRRRRHALPEGNGDSAARRLQHARQPVRLDSADPTRDGLQQRSRRPASTSSSSTRRATTSSGTGSRWTACCPTARSSPVAPRNRAQGFNSVLTTTHRQNFLVPPRRHRSFPLAEL